MGKISIDETQKFERIGFSGEIFVNKEENQGFDALLVDVHGKSPVKRILEGNTRSYYVVEGEGTFAIDEKIYNVSPSDLYVVSAGSEYWYEGNMKLFEFNISPDNSFGDETLVDNL